MTHLIPHTAWYLGGFLCKAIPYLQATAVSSSVNTLAVTAVERLVNTVYGVCVEYKGGHLLYSETPTHPTEIARSNNRSLLRNTIGKQK